MKDFFKKYIERCPDDQITILHNFYIEKSNNKSLPSFYINIIGKYLETNIDGFTHNKIGV